LQSSRMTNSVLSTNSSLLIHFFIPVKSQTINAHIFD
jgi:hypothetical protein